ncbi:MAG: hypothetical protein NW206_05275 [Hyphomonadaceae bacterium]|nr:hypothetical protein [Hyphomonadaceae bacterium]
MMRLTIAPFLLAAFVGLSSCGAKPAHDYPQTARAQFEQSCPAGDPVCACTWERLTQSLPHEEYEAALERYRTEGLMDPRVTRARTHCIERHREDS